MKKCNRCGLNKHATDFYTTTGRTIDGLQGCCKECSKEHSKSNSKKHKERYKIAQRAIREEYKLDYWEVYYLPEEHYVGISKNTRRRMSQHKGKGRITTGYDIIARFDRAVDAVWFESLFHQRGYNGCQFK